jgi:S1-C subfamily serine protease
VTRRDTPWHRPVPRPRIGTGPSIGGERPPVPKESGLRPPTPSPPSSNRPTHTNPNQFGSRTPSGGSGSPKRSRNGAAKTRVLQASAVMSGVLFFAGFIALLMNRSDAGDESARTTEVIPSTSPPVAVPPEDAGLNVVDSNWEDVARSVVYIEALGAMCEWTGSGSIVGDGSLVLTNQHVAGSGECDLTVYLTDSTSTTPTQYVNAEIVVADEELDLAVIQLRDASGAPFVATGRTPLQLSSEVPKLGDKLTILGYPGLGGSTITLTSGDFSGVDRSETFEYLKTTANMNPGVSGGSAFNSNKQLIGIPTAGRGAEIACDGRTDCVANGSTIGLLRPASLAREILSRAAAALGRS